MLRELALAVALAAAGEHTDPFAAYAAGDYEAALRLFLDAQVEMPEDARLAYNVGNAYFRAGDFVSAERAYAQAAKSADPALRQRATYNRGNAAAKAGDLGAAIEHYEAALGLAPDDADARHNLEVVKQLLEQQKAKQQQQGGEQNDGDEQREQQDGGEQAQNGQQGRGQPAGQEPREDDGSEAARDGTKPGEQSGTQEQPGQSAPGQTDERASAAARAATAQPGKLSQEEANRYLMQLREARPERRHRAGKNARPAGGKDW